MMKMFPLRRQTFQFMTVTIPYGDIDSWVRLRRGTLDQLLTDIFATILSTLSRSFLHAGQNVPEEGSVYLRKDFTIEPAVNIDTGHKWKLLQEVMPEYMDICDMKICTARHV